MAEVLALTGASKPSLYRWMEKHPVLDERDESSLLGHPFPKPVRKEGREVVWDGDDVEAWWAANSMTVGRQTETTTISWENFRAAMLVEPESRFDEATDQEVIDDDMELVQRFERNGPEVRVWFRNASEAVFFKLKYG